MFSLYNSSESLSFLLFPVDCGSELQDLDHKPQSWAGLAGLVWQQTLADALIKNKHTTSCSPSDPHTNTKEGHQCFKVVYQSFTTETFPDVQMETFVGFIKPTLKALNMYLAPPDLSYSKSPERLLLVFKNFSSSSKNNILTPADTVRLGLYTQVSTRMTETEPSGGRTVSQPVGNEMHCYTVKWRWTWRLTQCQALTWQTAVSLRFPAEASPSLAFCGCVSYCNRDDKGPPITLVK